MHSTTSLTPGAPSPFSNVQRLHTNCQVAIRDHSSQEQVQRLGRMHKAVEGPGGIQRWPHTLSQVPRGRTETNQVMNVIEAHADELEELER